MACAELMMSRDGRAAHLAHNRCTHQLSHTDRYQSNTHGHARSCGAGLSQAMGSGRGQMAHRRPHIGDVPVYQRPRLVATISCCSCSHQWHCCAEPQ
jgi:hypothetical protein